MTTFYLIRHAQSEGNSEGRIQGATDRALSPLGQQQLEPLAERCRSLSDAVHMYTSPLRRARETAQAANRHLKLPLTERLDIREIDVGQWENQTVEYIEAHWPEERRIWNEEHHLFEAPGGETMAQVYERVRGALLDLAQKHPDQAVIVVSHGCAIRNMCAWAMGGPEQAKYNRQGWVANTSISCIEVSGDGTPTLVYVGDDKHLGDLQAPKDKA